MHAREMNICKQLGRLFVCVSRECIHYFFLLVAILRTLCCSFDGICCYQISVGNDKAAC